MNQKPQLTNVDYLDPSNYLYNVGPHVCWFRFAPVTIVIYSLLFAYHSGLREIGVISSPQLSDFVAGGLTNCRSMTNPWKLLLIGYNIGYINLLGRLIYDYYYYITINIYIYSINIVSYLPDLWIPGLSRVPHLFDCKCLKPQSGAVCSWFLIGCQVQFLQ